MDFLDKYFRLSEHNTSVRLELMAGLTTFLAMAYITVVNPAILSEAGMDFGAVFVATCIAAAFGSIAMGLLGNYPIAMAPGMGQNAFFTYGIVLGLGHSWQTALGAVFISGLIFVMLSVLPIREWLINAIPRNLKLGIASGIGFFLGFIALKNAGIVTDHISIRTSSYHKIGEQEKTVRVHGMQYVIDNINAHDAFLLVDDVFDSGRSIVAILNELKGKTRRNMPENIKVATPWYKPTKNITDITPDYYLHETDRWLVFPHELVGLTVEDIKQGKQHLAEDIKADLEKPD